ncbi:MAG TPA: Rv3654c family TadE-like protein [Motilibacteraceae bacterium]|nr:Rv3654c family TadE-like protein [Motilibacteraceae bacterium]
MSAGSAARPATHDGGWRRPRVGPGGAERGSATILVLAMALAVAVCAAVPLAAAALGADRARAAAAADLAALAAASEPSLRAGGGPAGGCARAARVARAQGVRLLRCRALGVADVVVEVGVPPPGWLPGAGSGLVRARSRAGPADLGATGSG